MAKQQVLFVCIHNSARSQMAEAFLNQLGGEYFTAESAGIEPGRLNPLVVEVMREIGFDLSKNQTKSVFDFYQQGKQFAYVITVCDQTAAEKCPIFPGVTERLHWSFPDPARLTGSHAEKLAQTRVIRDQIRPQVEIFLSDFFRPVSFQ